MIASEDILRGWLVKFSEDAKIPDTDKARVQLLIAQNYAAAGRYEVARSEFTTVTNRYPKTPEAIDARFGIGETYMSQKIYDKSEEIFTTLSEAGNAKTTLRAEFLRGVLASRRGDRDAAREIFRTVLSRMPDVALADQALYQLSEVYGYEQRYLDQLELLRTVGRLGRESKRWHTPGLALSIVIQDTDLGISRGHSRIPVLVKTRPGGDTETVFLTSGGAGKGLFMAEIPTTLGDELPGDSTLQVTGGDTITVDYPEEFKQEFSFELPANSSIAIAADGKFAMASARIEDEEDESVTTALEREVVEEDIDERKSIARPASQIKPGNPIYMRVTDHDRNLSDDAGRSPHQGRRVQRRSRRGEAHRDRRAHRRFRGDDQNRGASSRRLGERLVDRSQPAHGDRSRSRDRLDQRTRRRCAEDAHGRHERSLRGRHRRPARDRTDPHAAARQPRRPVLVPDQHGRGPMHYPQNLAR